MKKKKIMRYTEFGGDYTNVCEYLYRLNIPDVTGLVNDLNSAPRSELKDLIEDILLEIGNLVSDDDYKKVEADLRKLFRVKN